MRNDDLTGKTFGKLTVINRQGSDKSGKNSMWLCKCDCGNEKIINRCSLVNASSLSCGCKRNPKPEIRIKNSINIDENQCWNWKKKLRKDGYGRMYYIDSQLPAHRASYEIFKGKVPRHKLVCHNCDNRKCVNPNHLYIGTHKDNAHDMVKRKRQNCLLGEKHQNSKFKNNEIKEIRNKFKDGNSITELSKEYKISYKTMWKIIKKRTWKCIK